MDTLDRLSTIYFNWLEEQKIYEKMDADELYRSQANLTYEQKNWLKLYIETWDISLDLEWKIDRLLFKKKLDQSEIKI